MRLGLRTSLGALACGLVMQFADAAENRNAPVPWERAADATNDGATGLPNRVVHRASGSTLVLIPAGEFLMGSPTNEVDRSKSETQHRRVIRKSFYLGETEVTVEQFRKFVEATSYKTDAERGVDEGNGHGVGSFATVADGEREWSANANWRTPFPILKDVVIGPNHPVHHVSWNDAKAFCVHYKLRLPTEAEWE
jgi:sulfatase modifying factor 1